MEDIGIELTNNSFLVSETDEEGIIRFANDQFCNFSEFNLEEIIGKPHSIVRHPDMPKVVFEELWNTIKSGNRWKGFVKNKTKSGKYYWVYSTIYPYISCDGSKGFISCRRKASKDEIEKYANIYKTMK
ncbi:PAS sensor domain-containing protein [Malaciobacter molluscorum LMG 25693]|uniref:PAS sensor domain-containing protein n=1 Tax=Malaciobacter molluscorum LMG 25693 TaxID=870501 RepID=A0A2G1DGZ7_9BACT|nr:PAS domain-containing protein [Malaciobacter molluscorum]AXX92301.1 PAS sensor-containing signal transduction protein [Malaciobacter molluscorum LMG 25693]PHO17714.1 PAS sensor domain-containing protein [Malaciobacter molluscorum LMG 25693]RXJ93547.1 PAS sensor domain-containing protein [Malaciobacter molluscorum]